MDFVERKEYIDKIKPFINKPVIKVITGMRRVGKSTLELLKIKTDIELLEYLTPLLKDKKDVVGTNKKILKEYYQVSYLLETEETRNREFGVYQKVNDNYLKWDYTVFV